MHQRDRHSKWVPIYFFVLRTTSSPALFERRFAYRHRRYLANSDHFAKLSTNTCLLLNALSRMANSRTSLPLGFSLFSDLLGLTKSFRKSPSWQYTAFAVCTNEIGTPSGCLSLFLCFAQPRALRFFERRFAYRHRRYLANSE